MKKALNALSYPVSQTRLEAQQNVLNDIYMFYNSYRLHSYLGYKSRNQYEAEMAEMEKAV